MADDAPVLYKPAALIGHEDQQALIRQLYDNHKMPHGILLYGPKGVGKRLLAENIGWMLCCGAAADATKVRYDESSPNAPVMEHGAYGGYQVIEREKSFITVEQVRSVNTKLAMADEGWRVVIIDAADDMNTAAANALLKTLEEPQGQTVLILISHAPSKLLPTIISRCRKFRLSALNPENMQKVLSSQGAETTEAAISMAEGAPGIAIELSNKASTDTVEQLNSIFQNKGRFDVSQTAEQLLKAAPAPSVAFESLLWYIAQEARKSVTEGRADGLKWSRCHQRAQAVAADQSVYNLTAQLAMEKVLQDLQQTLHA